MYCNWIQNTNFQSHSFFFSFSHCYSHHYHISSKHASCINTWSLCWPTQYQQERRSVVARYCLGKGVLPVATLVSQDRLDQWAWDEYGASGVGRRFFIPSLFPFMYPRPTPLLLPPSIFSLSPNVHTAAVLQDLKERSTLHSFYSRLMEKIYSNNQFDKKTDQHWHLYVRSKHMHAWSLLHGICSISACLFQEAQKTTNDDSDTHARKQAPTHRSLLRTHYVREHGATLAPLPNKSLLCQPCSYRWISDTASARSFKQLLSSP